MEKNYTFKTLETSRMILRKMNDDDLEFVFKHFSNEDVCRYLYDNEPLKTKRQAQRIIDVYKEPDDKDHNRWIFVNKMTNKLMGTCGFHCWDKVNNIAEVGYDLEKKFWKKGYMKEGLKKIIKFGFSEMSLNRIQAYISLDNEASYKLLESLVFKREGIIRDKHLYRGKYYDHYCYSLLKREYK